MDRFSICSGLQVINIDLFVFLSLVHMQKLENYSTCIIEKARLETDQEIDRQRYRQGPEFKDPFSVLQKNCLTTRILIPLPLHSSY